MADPENQDTEKAPSLTKEYIIPGIIKTAEFVSSFLIVYILYISHTKRNAHTDEAEVNS